MLFLLAVGGRALLRPLPEVISGLWNITEVSVTGAGLPSPDVVDFSVEIRPATESTFSGTVMPTLSSLTVSLGENESFGFALADRFHVDAQLETSAGGTRYVHGVTGNATFSFVILSSWRVELTLIDRATQEVTLYRGLKENTKGLLKRFSEGFGFFIQNLGLRIL
jgi:hypothetical protein